MRRGLASGAAAIALLSASAAARIAPEASEAPFAIYPYVGATLGGDSFAAQRTDRSGATTGVTDGLGGQGFGWDVQAGALLSRAGSSWSFGVEGSYGESDARFEVSSPGYAGGFEAGRSWSIVGVVGYQWCPCGFTTLRLGWRQTEFTDFSPTGSLTEDLGGLTVGTEFGFPIADQVMLKLGYDYTFYDDFKGAPFPGTTREVTPEGERIRVGLDLFFGGDGLSLGGAPVTETHSTTQAMPPTEASPIEGDAQMGPDGRATAPLYPVNPDPTGAIYDQGPTEERIGSSTPMPGPVAPPSPDEGVPTDEVMGAADSELDHWSFSVGATGGFSTFGGEQTDRFGSTRTTTDSLSGQGAAWSASLGAAYRFKDSPIFVAGDITYGDANATYEVTSGSYRAGFKQGTTWGVTGMIAYTPCPCGYGGVRLGWRQAEFTDFSPAGLLSLDLSGLLVGVEFGVPVAEDAIVTLGYDATFFEDFEGSPSAGVQRRVSPESREIRLGARLTW